MEFEQALKALRVGKKIRIKNWVDTYLYKDQLDNKFYKKEISLSSLPIGLDLKLAFESEWEIIDENAVRFVLYFDIVNEAPLVSKLKYSSKDEFYNHFSESNYKFIKFLEEFEINCGV